ncbi:MAG TPA: DHHA1 domain-containing protein [Anaerolineae bacterium]|nr:DHHA1 domain-containing protein [Anaerolineae bacterium]HQI84720.1 DHHA1 domain-containing protein [Anaerolineae bacterium]
MPTPSPEKSSESLAQAAGLLHKSQRPLLISHPRPDGDTVGSALALRLALIRLGKTPRLACVHPIPATLMYLPGADMYTDVAPQDTDFDLVVAVDLSDLGRTGGIYQEDWRGAFPLLVIDHHETNDNFGDVNLVAPQAAATALPMAALIDALGAPLDGAMATCLLAGILTDTRGLRTSNTSPDVLKFVSRLIEAGGDYPGVMEKSLDSVPYQQMRGWGVALSNLQLDGELAWTTFPLEEKIALGIEDHDDLDLGNLITRVAEAKMMATFLEMRDGTVKVSLRSRPGYNVAQIAKVLGGGGHQQAAGCSVSGDLPSAQALVLPLLRAELARC